MEPECVGLPKTAQAKEKIRRWACGPRCYAVVAPDSVKF